MSGNQQPSLMSNRLEGSTTRADLELDSLPPKEKAFLKACIFGDGWLGLQRNAYTHLRIGHSAKQLNWLKYKAERINKILRKNRKILGPYWQSDGKTKEKKHPSYLFCIDDHHLFKPWFERWYEVPDQGDVMKHVTPDFLSGLGVRELAILWCDDGSVISSNRFTKYTTKDGKLKLYPYVEAKGQLALCSFTDKEQVLLQQWLYSVTGMHWNVNKRSKDKRTTLTIGKNKLREFLPMIAPYVPNCMSYKVDLSHCRIKQGKSPTSAEQPI